MSGLLLVSYIALWVLVVVMAVLLLLLYRHFGMMALGTLEGVQRDGLAVGAPAPVVSGITAEGVDRGWEPKRPQPQMLLFMAPDCEPCAAIMPHLVRLTRAAGDRLFVSAIVPGQRAAAIRMAEKFGSPIPTLAEDGSGAFQSFRVRVTPFGFVIGTDGRVLAKGLISDPVRLRQLLQAAGLKEEAAFLQTQPAPLVPQPHPSGAASRP
ncbi:MAG: TlpA family protein disulfide reductase [Thermomicrobiales bacterium]|nr:TlpA family protein disulfide reductase [Thermomicrobiales bacterium]